jgi:hypothetical protein
MCWPHVNPVPSGAVGKDCQRRLLSRPRFVRACSATDFILYGLHVIKSVFSVLDCVIFTLTSSAYCLAEHSVTAYWQFSHQTVKYGKNTICSEWCEFRLLYFLLLCDVRYGFFTNMAEELSASVFSIYSVNMFVCKISNDCGITIQKTTIHT